MNNKLPPALVAARYEAFRQSSCVCKERHQTKCDALIAASQFLKSHESDSDYFRPYPCHFCYGWHLTTKQWKPRSCARTIQKNIMKTPPQTIYLQFYGSGETPEPTDDTVEIDRNDITWHDEEVYNSDIVYVRTELLDAARASCVWNPVARFPQTKSELESWYCPPANREEADAEMPIDFPGYPKLGEIHEETMMFGHVMQVAASKVVETRSRDGFLVSARWVWHKYSMGAYRWEVAPRKWNIELRDVDGWRAISEVKTDEQN